MAGKLKANENRETDAAEQANSTAEAVSCGERLREERTKQKLTTQAVASQLRLSSTQIEALEQDDFDALPEPTIVKGFIRNYAKLLKIPAEPILAAYASLTPEGERYDFALAPGINMKLTEGSNKPKRSYRWMVLALVLLGIGGWFLYQYYIQKPDVVDPMTELSEALPESQALQIPEQTVPTTVPNAEIAAETMQADDVAVDNTTATSEASDEASAEAASVEAETTVAEGQTKITFHATQETWLSVVNTAGKEVYNTILYAGDQDMVQVVNPKEITVGNAHGVTLTVDGKSIALAPYIRGNVARIRLD